ncbi:MAG: MBL fold metallo-hydrolase, partial [Microbacterium sp.]
SHDQHADNLDELGRALLRTVPLVLTTAVAAGRLDAVARGLAPWSSHRLGRLAVTAVPAQHGPDGTEHLVGPVIGFVLAAPDLPTVYVSGDNASLDVVRSIARRFARIDVAVLFAGAGRTAVFDSTLTLTAAQAAEATEILGGPRVLVAHTDEWAHLTEDYDTVLAAFADAALSELLIDNTPGRRSAL